jgi:hypothetical protein
MALLILLVTGCGTSSNPLSDQEIAENALLSLKDLPSGTHVRSNVVPAGAPCGPIPAMKANRADESSTFAIDGTEAQQVIGVFSIPASARAGLAALTSPNRLSCISATLKSFTAAVSVVSQPPKSVHVGDEGQRVTLIVTESRSTAPSHIDIVTIRLNRIVTELLFLTKGRSPTTDLLSAVAASAIGRIDEVQQS